MNACMHVRGILMILRQDTIARAGIESMLIRVRVIYIFSSIE
jgi:hypothetical protein